MGRRRRRPETQQLVREYSEEGLGIIDLMRRHKVVYEDVYRPLSDAGVLRGPERHGASGAERDMVRAAPV